MNINTRVGAKPAFSATHVLADVSAGVVVFLVALPLCLGIAMASGAPFFSGLIAGIVGGLVIGVLSGSQLSVSGPAAGLTAIVLSSIQQLGSFEIFLLAVVIAGLFQLVLGLLHAGSITNYFPSSVIKGMLTAIGVSIIMKQLPHALGVGAAKWEYTNLVSYFSQAKPLAILICLISIGILVLWEQPFMQKLKMIPAGLVVVIVGVVLNQMVGGIGTLGAVLDGSFVVNVPKANSVSEFMKLFSLPDFNYWANPQVYKVAFTLAIVASIETLLCIEATDKLDPEKRLTSTNRELVAQGAGNLVSGLIGGLPITSVIVRSSANLNAGAKSKLATIVHGFLLLSCTALIPDLLNKIPLASLAGILLLTGYKLTKPAIYWDVYKKGNNQWLPFIITVIAVVATDLLTGVGVGLATSLLVLVYSSYKRPVIELQQRDSIDGQSLIELLFFSEVTFLNKPYLKKVLNDIPSNTGMIINTTGVTTFDHDVQEELHYFLLVTAPNKNISIEYKGSKAWLPNDYLPS